MSLFILLLVVMVAGVVIAWRSETSKGGSPTLGLWCLVGGLIAAAGVVMIGQSTYGWAAAFDLPGWLRIVTFWMLPAGVVAAAILGTLSLRRNAGRALGITGLVLAALSAAAFIAMVASVEY